MPEAQFVDSAVSRLKFDEQISEFVANREAYRERGWFLIDAIFPMVTVLMAAPQTSPPAIVTGVLFDYSNYDVEPPSVLLVNPFTGVPYVSSEVPTQMFRSVITEGDAGQFPILPPGLGLSENVKIQAKVRTPLVVAASPQEIPFICLAGIREYHNHPAHSGDAWDLYRTDGAGRLVRILEMIDMYGVKPITGYEVQLRPQITGFSQIEPPE